MIGAIIGDVVGSVWEFSPTNDYNFPLLTKRCSYTDDTICTVAVADALMGDRDYGRSLHAWCRRFPHPMGSYGGRFSQWVNSCEPKPYGSFGNGSAMRVSAVGWLCVSRDEVLCEARRSAECTHNHPEGVKGAQAVALAIFDGLRLRREGNLSVDEVLRGAIELSGYDVNIKLENVINKFDESCQGTVPVALWIVAQSSGFEDAVRRAVSLGADADTLGAIVGGIAEAVWGVPNDLRDKVLAYLPEELLEVVRRFESRL